MWGIFNDDDPAVLHVMPCTEEGKKIPGHVKAIDCPCRPKVMPVGPMGLAGRLISHREPGHPGSNDRFDA